MNYYELEKKATPGPLEFRRTLQGCALHPRGGCSPTGRLWYWWEENHRSADPNHEANRQTEADMRFDAHCRNNFGKALEALKTHECQWQPCSTCKLIAELEEVQG